MRSFSRWLWAGGACALVVACAEGGTDTGFGGGPTQTNQPTDPGKGTVPSDSPAEQGEQGNDAGTTTGTDAGSGTGSNDAAADVITPPVDSGACTTTAPSNLCGLSPQCGCASNQTCDITNLTNGYASCILAGGGPLASLCTTSSQCAAGLTCAYGACRPFCSTVGSACATPGTNKCTTYANSAGTPIVNGLVCTIACDPLAPSAVCGSNNCIWDPSVASTDCDKAGPVGIWGECAAYNACVQGTACIYNSFFAVNECEPFCRVGHNEDCPLFSFCQDIYGATAPMSGAFKLGHCQ